MEIGILGGGIAGLSVALALHKQGHTVRVYERRAGPATMGAGVTLWPNAGFVLQELGLLTDIAAVAGRPSSVHRKDAGGESLGGLDIRQLDQMMGYPTHTILRRDLQAVLLDHVTRAGIQVEFGYRAVAIDLDPSGKAVARFENEESIRPDLLIGADGRMGSVARRFVVGDNTPIYQGFVNWIGIKRKRDCTFRIIWPGCGPETTSSTGTVHQALKTVLRPGPCGKYGVFGAHETGPPLTESVWPVIQLAKGEARKRTAFEMSSG